MRSQASSRSAELAGIIAEYSARADAPLLRTKLERFAGGSAPEEITALAEPYKDEPDVIAPLYERLVAAGSPTARALVILANAYWLQGRGPEVVGELANRAIATDSADRGAWHLWALSESDPRKRTRRWEQVAERFPEDTMALAAVADNAAGVAGAEGDAEMLALAITTFERLRDRSNEPAEQAAVDNALRALRGWRL